MKARFIFAAMAALAIVSCNKNEVETPVTSLEGPSAMMKVNIMSANGMTKAYSDGTAEENKVSKVEFYFYDAAGAAYSVVPGGNSITWTSQDPAGDNIEKISDAVLVIKQAETTPPTQVVAVLNGTESYEGLSLAQLGAKVVKALHKNNTDFVMTNSVYYDGGSADAVVVATQITQDNIFVIADGTNTPGVGEAMELPAGVEPIDIYVERVAAKVKDSPATVVCTSFPPTLILAASDNTFVASITGTVTTTAVSCFSVVVVVVVGGVHSPEPPDPPDPSAANAVKDADINIVVARTVTIILFNFILKSSFNIIYEYIMYTLYTLYISYASIFFWI